MTMRKSDKTKIRKCLKCQEDFLSEWSGNRSCKRCLRITPNYAIHNRYVDGVLSETGRRIGSHISAS